MAAIQDADRRTRAELADGLRQLGLPVGGLVMIHASLRSLGPVHGGAGAVVDALLDALGPRGTLVIPVFRHAPTDPQDVFDPKQTPGVTGAISEAGWRRPDAIRSIHLTQTLAAIGPRAAEVVYASGDDGWDAEGPMHSIWNLDGSYLLLGVPYQNLTAGHSFEFKFGKHRKPRIISGRVRRADGSIQPITSRGHGPDPDFPGMPERSYDFNRLGQALEDRGGVARGAVGNAIARLFSARAIHDLAAELYAADPELFFKVDDQVTPLTYGVTWRLPSGPKAGEMICVVDPRRVYSPE